ncbi:MAG: hypothetical protein Q8914_09975, partial [Bacteroidota bacterium]|nr:hypothetical protein [Bacteroidota bacterium]
FLLMAVVAICCSCTKEVKDEPDVLWKVINLEAKSTDWTAHTDANGLNLYYSCTFDMPEITNYVYANGAVLGYYVMNNAQESLPYVRHYQDIQNNYWTQTIDFDYSVGSVTAYVTNSDFFNERPSTMDFRVVLMW